MIEIKRMFHKKTGEIIFEDINGQWWVQEYQFNDISVGNQGEWLPVVVSKIEKPKELKEWFEANALDGDKIQDGQTLSSELCFELLEEAVNQSLLSLLERDIEMWEGEMEKESLFVIGFDGAISKTTITEDDYGAIREHAQIIARNQLRQDLITERRKLIEEFKK